MSRNVITASEVFQAEMDQGGKPHPDSWVKLPEWGHEKAPEGTEPNHIDSEGFLLDDNGKRVPLGCYVLDLSLTERSKCRKSATTRKTGPEGVEVTIDNELLEAALAASQACDGDGVRLFKGDAAEQLMGCRGSPVSRIAARVLDRAGDAATGI